MNNSYNKDKKIDEDALFKFDDTANENDNLFNEDSESSTKITANKEKPWKVLIVDDEEDVHAVTHLALDGFELQDRSVEFIDAFSAEEAKKILREDPQIAIILLDVVMEYNQAGLDLVKFIREDLNNHFVRIILRTGQPGEAPERSVIKSYQINDYKTKTELTSDKLFTAVLASLRTYEAMVTIDMYRKNLEVKVKERTSKLEKSLSDLQFAQKEIIQLERKNSALAMAVTANHELNQPLMVLQGNLEMFLSTMDNCEISEKQQKYLDRMQTALDRLGVILNRYEKMDKIRFDNYSESSMMVVIEDEE